jgi:hypothetical protein
VLLAGEYAEARHRHISHVVAFLDGAADDMQMVQAIARDLFSDVREQLQFEKDASVAMRRLMRGRLPAIIRIANVLHVRGELCDDDLHAVLKTELGDQPRYLAVLDE